MKQQDEYGFRWTSHRDGSISAPVTQGAIATKVKIEPSGSGFSVAVHGVCLTNPNAVETSGPYGFIEKYRWPTIDDAKQAALTVVRPR